MKKILIHSVIMIGLTAFMGAQAGYTKGYNAEADAHKLLKQTKNIAAKQQKNIFIVAGNDGCIWCRYLDKFITTNSKVKNQIAHDYAAMKVYIGPKNLNTNFFTRAKLPMPKSTPHFYVLKPNGKLLTSFATGPLEQGQGYNPTKVSAFLQKWR